MLEGVAQKLKIMTNKFGFATYSNLAIVSGRTPLQQISALSSIRQGIGKQTICAFPIDTNRLSGWPTLLRPAFSEVDEKIHFS